MEKLTIADLINYAYEDNPSKIQSSFDSIIADKIQLGLQQKKIEIANSLFNDQEIEYEDEMEDQDENEIENNLDDNTNIETEEEESE